jgi:hypothetical protein
MATQLRNGWLDEEVIPGPLMEGLGPPQTLRPAHKPWKGPSGDAHSLELQG